MRLAFPFILKSSFTVALLFFAFQLRSQNVAIDTTLNASQRNWIIDSVISNLNRYYIFPESAKEIEKQLRLKQRRKEYDAYGIAKDFTTALTKDLRSISRDKHLSVNFSKKVLEKPNQQGLPTQEEKRQLKNYGDDINYGIEKLERLPGNVGYMKITLFFPLEFSVETIAAAMNFVGNTEALIIDLQGNDGGTVETVNFFLSYFFTNERVQLSSIYQKKLNKIEEHYTLPYVPGKRYATKGVFILTDNRTFSGGEAFAYEMKYIRKAMVIGDTTEGAAHPRDVFRLSDHFWMGIPVARPINPITNSNWEGVGVIPDMSVPKEQAVFTAHTLALKHLISQSTNENEKNNLKKQLERLESSKK